MSRNQREQNQKQNKRERGYFTAREMRTIQEYDRSMKEGSPKAMSRCAVEAGYSPSYAAQKARHIYNVLSNNERLQADMERRGIGMKALVDDMIDLRKATLPDGETPDNFIRFKNMEHRSKLLDVIPSQKVDVNKRSITINITADTLEKIKEVKGEEEFKRITHDAGD